jgi:hypothetical protein
MYPIIGCATNSVAFEFLKEDGMIDCIESFTEIEEEAYGEMILF